MSSTTPGNLVNPPDRTPLALALEQALKELKARTDDLTLPLDSLNRRALSEVASATSFADSFEALLSNADTDMAMTDALQRESCPLCGTSFAKIVESTKNRAKDAIVAHHLATCDKTMSGRTGYINACSNVLAGEACPWKKCVRKGSVFPEDVEQHVKNHQHGNQTTRKHACTLFFPDGSRCNWKSVWPIQDEGDLAYVAPDLARHEEFVHGLPELSGHQAKYCEVSQQIFYGHVQIHEHWSHLLQEALSDNGRNNIPWIANLCPFCLYNESLQPVQRASPFPNRHVRNAHVLQQHIFVVAELECMPIVQSCPYPSCKADVHTADLPEHLLSAHGFNLTADTCETHIGRDFLLLTAAPKKGETSAHVGAFEVFMEWITSGKRGLEAKRAVIQAEADGQCHAAPDDGDAATDSAVGDDRQTVLQPRSIAPSPQVLRLRNLPSCTATVNMNRVEKMCLICLADQTIAPETRRHVYEPSAALAQHILVQHIYYDRSTSIDCPICGSSGHSPGEYVRHLETHNLMLSGKRGVHLLPDFSNLSSKPLQRKSRDHTEARELWIRWVQHGCPDNEFHAPNPDVTHDGKSRVKRPSRPCPFCRDDNQPKDAPCNQIRNHSKDVRHIVRRHIFDDRNPIRTCPICELANIPAGEFPLHLDTHNYSLSGSESEKLREDPLNVCETSKLKKEAWQAWVRAGCPAEAESDGQVALAHPVPREAAQHIHTEQRELQVSISHDDEFEASLPDESDPDTLDADDMVDLRNSDSDDVVSQVDERPRPSSSRPRRAAAKGKDYSNMEWPLS